MIVTRVLEECKHVFGQEVQLVAPTYDHFGDYAVNVMQLQPRPTHDQIDEYVRLLNESSFFEKVERVGAFINLFVSHTVLFETLQDALKDGTSYGKSDWGKGHTWAIEHTSPNPNKAMHLGHLRNNVIGMAISTIWEWAGISVIREAVDNNRGIAIARLMWGYLKHATGVEPENRTLEYWFDHQHQWHTPEAQNQNPGRFVDGLYVKASDDYKNDEAAQHAIKQMVIDWEAGDEKTWALWKTVLAYSYAGQELTLTRLGNKWDTVWHEHEHYEEGKRFVEDGLSKGVFVKTEEDTIITHLQEYGLADTVVQKSDGTSLYITQDIALTHLKLEGSRADHLYWVIGPEQTLALKQLFAVCEQLGIGNREQFTHISYGWMTIKGQGRMSSRSGNVVYIDDVLDEAVEKARTSIRAPQNLIDPIDAVAEAVGVGAVKYSLLRISRNQDTAFDFDESLSFEGNSGPYIQYSYARMKSILRKAQAEQTTESTLPTSLNSDEQLLLRMISRFPEIVVESAKHCAPHVICTYIFDLTQRYNAFYESSSVLEADSSELQTFRLGLTQATAHIVQNSLHMLGIDTVERM